LAPPRPQLRLPSQLEVQLPRSRLPVPQLQSGQMEVMIEQKHPPLRWRVWQSYGGESHWTGGPWTPALDYHCPGLMRAQSMLAPRWVATVCGVSLAWLTGSRMQLFREETAAARAHPGGAVPEVALLLPVSLSKHRWHDLMHFFGSACCGRSSPGC